MTFNPFGFWKELVWGLLLLAPWFMAGLGIPAPGSVILLCMLISLGLTVCILVGLGQFCGSKFKRRRLLIFSVITLLALLPVVRLGGQTRFLIFKCRLKEYEQVAETLGKTLDDPSPYHRIELDLAHAHLAKFVATSKENGVVGIFFFYGANSVFSHSGFLFVSNDKPKNSPNSAIKEFAKSWVKLAPDWYAFND